MKIKNAKLINVNGGLPVKDEVTVSYSTHINAGVVRMEIQYFINEKFSDVKLCVLKNVDIPEEEGIPARTIESKQFLPNVVRCDFPQEATVEGFQAYLESKILEKINEVIG